MKRALKKTAPMLATAAILGGCSTLPDLPPQVAMNRTGVSLPPAYDVSDLVIVTVTPDNHMIRGAVCEATSPYSTIVVTTPARARFPDFDAASPPINVTCSAGGLKGEAVSEPAWRSAATYGYPTYGLGWNSWYGPAVNVGWYGGYYGRRATIRYPQVDVVLEEPN
ncbi:hypothetical protein [Amaricoccus tamworthensis]|uniref:hypothetical protein n=1 Tax=Amaricoccus tamworthensis TaxID=57002 RepID=UPI003C7B6424